MIYIDEIKKCSKGVYCHLLADSTKELIDFAIKIGLKNNWIQKQNTCEEHFDLFNSYIQKARNFGAKLITARQVVAIIKNKRYLTSRTASGEKDVTQNTESKAAATRSRNTAKDCALFT